MVSPEAYPGVIFCELTQQVIFRIMCVYTNTHMHAITLILKGVINLKESG